MRKAVMIKRAWRPTAIVGTTILVPSYLVHLIGRSGTRKFDSLVPDLQTSCIDLAKCMGTSYVGPIMAAWATYFVEGNPHALQKIHFPGLNDNTISGRESAAICGWYRADSSLASSQSETSLQSNAVSHWIGVNQESALWDIKISLSFLERAHKNKLVTLIFCGTHGCTATDKIMHAALLCVVLSWLYNEFLEDSCNVYSLAFRVASLALGQL